MAHSSFFSVTLFSLLVAHCFCFNLKLLNASTQAFSPNWASGGATWYGTPEGSGTDGGSCGYGPSVGQPPFSSFVAAAGPSVYKNGEGCGTCYEVKCSSNAACSKYPVTITVIDICPGGPCLAEAVHFDLSGHAFGAMAVPGQAAQLRNAGNIKIEYRRVDCNYRGTNVVFKVDAGSNPNYFATAIEYQNGDGNIMGVELKEAGSASWSPMKRGWGATWNLNLGYILKAPFSIRITDEIAKSIVAENVIPVNWKPGTWYRSLVNFDPHE